MSFSVDSLLKDARVSLEKTAVDQFGAVVEDFTKGIFSPKSTSPQSKTAAQGAGAQRVWNATSYAAHLAGANDFRPKLKFLFKVEFNFTPLAMSVIKDLSPDFADIRSKEFTFMIKYVDRPKIDFEYEEDVNMYNFRTKVLKKVRHRELTIIFMDDAGNRVFDFFRILMMLHSPITRRQLDRDGTDRSPDAASVKFGSGMAFSENNKDNAHRGVFNSDFGNSIDSIRVKQIFIDPSPSEGVETMVKMVSFDFLNPRIVSFDLDELSHEANDVNLLTMVFDYDWMEMVNIGSVGTSQVPLDPGINIITPEITDAPSDFSSNKVSGGRPVGGKGKVTSPNTTGANGAKIKNEAAGNVNVKSNPFVNAITGVLGRQVSNLTSDAINKLIPTTGSGLGGRLAGVLNNQVNGVVNPMISGIVQNSAKEKLNLVADAASSAVSSVITSGKETFTSIKNKSMVNDSTTATPPAPKAVVSSTDPLPGFNNIV